MSRDVLREFVRDTLKEFIYFVDPYEEREREEALRKRKKGPLKKIYDFFMKDDYDKFLDEWIEDVEDTYDVDLSDKSDPDVVRIRKAAVSSVKEKKFTAIKRARGDREGAKSFLRTILNRRLWRPLTNLSAKQRKQREVYDPQDDFEDYLRDVKPSLD